MEVERHNHSFTRKGRIVGQNIEILAESSSTPGLHCHHAVTLELQECVHFHMEDFRFMWTVQELLAIAKAFEQAQKKVIELGIPESLEHMQMLGQVILDGDRLHQNRWAMELTKDGTIHFHNKSLRTHMFQADFQELCELFREASIELRQYGKQSINLSNAIIKYHPVVKQHRETLRSYISSNRQADPNEVVKLEYQRRWYRKFPQGKTEDTLQRPNGLLPTTWPGTVPDDFDKRYLYTIYESIKHFGYACGPFWGQLIPAYKQRDGSLYLIGSHRVASLLELGINQIDVFVCEPPSDWYKGETE